MVALQQPLHSVYDTGMDEFLRCGLQSHLHLRTIAVCIGSERQCPRLDEKSRHHRFQRPSFTVHTLPRLNLVLFDRQSPADQVGKNGEQTLASITHQHCPTADNLLRGNSDTHLEVAPGAKSCPIARNSLGSLLHGRLHRSFPASSIDLPSRNCLSARSLARREWRSHQRYPKPSSHRDPVLVRDRCRVLVSWYIPVPVNSYRDWFGPCKKGVRSDWISDDHHRDPCHRDLPAPV